MWLVSKAALLTFKSFVLLTSNSVFVNRFLFGHHLGELRYPGTQILNHNIRIKSHFGHLTILQWRSGRIN
jgi:hypothetical protein